MIYLWKEEVEAHKRQGELQGSQETSILLTAGKRNSFTRMPYRFRAEVKRGHCYLKPGGTPQEVAVETAYKAVGVEREGTSVEAVAVQELMHQEEEGAPRS
jgi:hypothetical protein